MIIKKSKFSYVAWALFLVAAFYTLFVSSFGIAEIIGYEGMELWAGIGLFVTLALGITLMLGLRAVVKLAENQISDVGSISFVAEGISLFFLVVISFVIRFLYITYFDVSAMETSSFLSMAMDGEFSKAYEISAGAFLYTKFLSGTILFFGAKAEAGMYLNLVFQIFIMLCIYFALRMFVNKFAGFAGGILYMCLPPCLSEMVEVSPEVMLTLFHSIAILLIFSVATLFYRQKLSGSIALGMFAVTGAMIGFVMFLDLSGVALLVMALTVLFLGKNKSESKSGVSFCVAVLVLAFAIAFMVGCFVKSTNLGTDFATTLAKDYLEVFKDMSLNLKIATPGYGSWYSLVFMVLGIFLIFRIFKLERDFTSPYMLYVFFVTIVAFLNISTYSYTSLVNFMWIFVGVFGILSLGTYSIPSQVANVDKEPPLEEKKEVSKMAKTTVAPPKKTSAKPGQPSVVSRNDSEQNVKNLEASLEFLKKDSEDNKSVEHAVVKSPTSAPLPVKNPAKPGETSAVNNGQKEVAPKNSLPAAPAASAEVSYVGSEPDAVKEEGIVKGSMTVLPTGGNVENSPAPVPKPAVKYGRRMDYKTAVVSSPRGNVSNKTAPFPSPASMPQTKTAENLTTPMVENEKTVVTQPHTSATIPSQTPQNAVNSAPGMPVQTPTPSAKASDVTAPSQQEMISKPIAKDVAVSSSQPTSVPIAETKNPEQPKAPSNVGKPIHNPLPTPKKHVAKEMDFDLQPNAGDMHFDLVDLSGRDYFDIN